MIKVIWLGTFSNEQVRQRIKSQVSIWEPIVRKLTGRQAYKASDFAQWNTNAINSFNEGSYDVDLTVICVHTNVRGGIQRFDIDKVHYVLIDSRTSNLWDNFKRRILHIKYRYGINRKRILDEIARIKPDIVHIMGAENPQYSLSALDIPNNIPVLVQLQTLLNNPELKKYRDYKELEGFEREVLLRSDYIGTRVSAISQVIREYIKPNPTILNIGLCVGEKLNLQERDTKYDFVYFSANLYKAADLAVEAFILAHKENPNITLDIIGAYSESLFDQLTKLIKKGGVEKAVFFEGRLATHDDVIRQIRKSRFALIPLKADFLSGTCREAMANGLPLLTTRTQGDNGTILLNKDRETALISEIGNHQALATNMLRLINEPGLADRLREAGARYITENYSNQAVIDKWFRLYPELIDNFHHNTKISDVFLNN